MDVAVNAIHTRLPISLQHCSTTMSSFPFVFTGKPKAWTAIIDPQHPPSFPSSSRRATNIQSFHHINGEYIYDGDNPSMEPRHDGYDFDADMEIDQDLNEEPYDFDMDDVGEPSWGNISDRNEDQIDGALNIVRVIFSLAGCAYMNIFSRFSVRFY
jgi:hypothetical protein